MQCKAAPTPALLRAKRGPHSPEFDAEDLGAFKALCARKCGSLCHAWRLVLDPRGVGRVSFVAFAAAARSMGFPNAKGLWALLDENCSGHISLDQWDAVSFRNLIEFREICISQFGGMDTAFLHGMDRTGSRTVSFTELEQFCDDMEFSGDVKALFKALDEHRHGFITGDELDFLSRWQGERFSTRNYEIQHGCSVARMRRSQKQRKVMREKILREEQRGKAERENLEHLREEREQMVSPSRIGSRAPSICAGSRAPSACVGAGVPAGTAAAVQEAALIAADEARAPRPPSCPPLAHQGHAARGEGEPPRPRLRLVGEMGAPEEPVAA